MKATKKLTAATPALFSFGKKWTLSHMRDERLEWEFFGTTSRMWSLEGGMRNTLIEMRTELSLRPFLACFSKTNLQV